MKKTNKILLIAAGIMAGCGALILAGVLLFYHWLSEPVTDDGAVRTEYSFPDADISSIELDVSSGAVKIRQGAQWSVSMTNVYPDGVSCKVTDGVLTLSSCSANDVTVFGWDVGLNFNFNSLEAASVTITVPYGTTVDTLDIDVGAGSLEITDITADRAILQLAVGDITIKASDIRSESYAQIGIGSFTAEDTLFDSSSVDIGIGVYN